MRTSLAGWLGLGLLLLSQQGATQSSRAAVLRGSVQTDKGEAVEGARVEIKGLGLSATTRADGSFRLEEIKPGRYWIIAAHSGTGPERRAITLNASEDRVIDFHLGPLGSAASDLRAAELDSLYLAFAERMRSSLDGVFLTRDDIERSREPQLGAVLVNYLIQTSPRSGVRSGANCAPYESWVWQQAQAQSRFRSDPQAYPFISVNGARPFRGRALYEFDPADVQALEFYRGAGPSFGYITSSAQCGLVIVWTK